jgi:uncharacterized protein involved in exopolysaccharide biosynthesis
MNAEFGTVQQGPAIGDYVSVIRRRLWHVVVPFVLFSAAGFGVAFLVPKEYRARTEVIVNDPDSQVSPMFAAVGFSIPHKNLLTTIPNDVKRTEFVWPLIEQFGVTEGFRHSIPREKAQLIDRIKKKLVVLPVLTPKGSDFVEFSYVGRDAVRVTAFINAIRSKWQEDVMLRYGQSVQAVLDNIRIVYSEASTKYLEANAKLKNFQAENGSAYFGKDPAGDAAKKIEALRADLANSELELESWQGIVQRIDEQLKTVPNSATLDTSKKRNPEWIKQDAVIAAGAATIREMEQIFLDDWPNLKKAKRLLKEEEAKLEKIEPFLTDAQNIGPPPILFKLNNDKAEAQNKIAFLQKRIAESKRAIAPLEADLRHIPEKAAKAQELRDAVNAAYVQFEKAGRAREAANATRERVGTKSLQFFRVTHELTLEEAKFLDPVYPNFALFAGIGAFIGLLIGGGLAFIAEFSSQSFTTPNQVRYMLQVPVLGEVAPMITRQEVRTRSRRKVTGLTIAIILGLAIVALHVMYFDPDWKAELPPWLRDFMRKLYGGGRR